MKQMTLLPVREPCGMICECEWGSLHCLEKNGRIFDRRARKFIRDDDGNILIGRRECNKQ